MIFKRKEGLHLILSDTLSAHLPERPTAVALGFFDGIHRGHTKVISAAVQAARQQGLIPCVFTFSPAGKGRPPKPVGELIQTDEVKQYILERMGVRQIFRPPFEEFRDLTPEEFVRKVLAERFQARVCGLRGELPLWQECRRQCRTALPARAGVWHRSHRCAAGAGEWEVISSTLIRKALRDGEIETANRLLGHPYTLIAPVVHGRGLGRQWNYPTANQYFPDEQIIPQNGVYATIAVCDGKRYVGSTNVGKKPTVGGQTVLSETFLVDYKGDLYGKNLIVEFYILSVGRRNSALWRSCGLPLRTVRGNRWNSAKKYREIPLQTDEAVLQSIGN